MLIDCTCGATNRIPGMSAQRHRCGKCKHEFTPRELARARQEPPPSKPEMSLGDMFGADDAGNFLDEFADRLEAAADKEAFGRMHFPDKYPTR